MEQFDAGGNFSFGVLGYARFLTNCTVLLRIEASRKVNSQVQTRKRKFQVFYFKFTK